MPRGRTLPGGRASGPAIDFPFRIRPALPCPGYNKPAARPARRTAMTPISFAFKTGISRERQEEVLTQVGQLTGVQKVARLLPDSSDPVVQRMCNLYVRAGADPAEVVRQV